jgi:hypothetical protein
MSHYGQVITLITEQFLEADPPKAKLLELSLPEAKLQEVRQAQKWVKRNMEVFEKPRRMRRSLGASNLKIRYSCCKCPMEFDRNYDLKRHVRLVHDRHKLSMGDPTRSIRDEQLMASGPDYWRRRQAPRPVDTDHDDGHGHDHENAPVDPSP